MLDHIDHDGVLELRLARPPVNALNTALLTALEEAVSAAPAQGFKAIVLSGREGMFSAGLDVPYLLELDREGMAEFWRRFIAALAALARSEVPVAAALTGHSPAGGAVLALFCDYRIAAEGEFKIGLNEVRVGLPVPEVILRALVRQVGPRQAERLAVPGLLINPEEARTVGLVDEVVPVTEVTRRALAWARGLASLPPGAMARTRGLARADLVALFDAMAEGDYRILNEVWYSDETQQTMRALVAELANKKKS